MKRLSKKIISCIVAIAVMLTTVAFNFIPIENKVYASTNEINIYVEKPTSWNNIWIWYDDDLSTSEWNTTTLASEPGDLQDCNDGWYKKTLNSSKVQFLFNDGTWNNKLTDNSKDFTTDKDIWIKSDGSYSYTDPREGGEVTENSVKVHFYTEWSNPKFYYWSTEPGSNKNTWPGEGMTSEGDNWYSYELKGVNSTKLIFNDGGSNQTDDLDRTNGEWWYYNNQWSSTKPIIKAIPPIPDPPKFSRTDFRDETIYFLMTSRFYDGDTSNNTHCWDDKQAKNPDSDPAWRGDFKGLIEKLDYIKALGFTAIWITPVVENASGYDYHGYHAINFSKVDSRYESDTVKYQDLINAAHVKGIKVIQDIVLNHTGNFGEENLFPMFKKDDSNLDSIDCLKMLDPESLLPANYDTLSADAQYKARIDAMKEDENDKDNIYHHEKSLSWEGYTVETGQIAGDCVDLNTENSKVRDYLVNSYDKYIDMGVDALRLDTVKHISRLTLNKEYIPAFKEEGKKNNKDLFMFGEIASRYRQVWNNDLPPVSTPFYTWNENKDYPWSTLKERENSTWQHWNDNISVSSQPTSNNYKLNGNDYHTPDTSMASGLNVIDFPMHWNFNNARDAFNVAVGGDKYYNDPTWNVTYVDSHDYAPDCAPENQRFAGSQDTWAENLNLMFTFRGIPTIYYGSEIEFMKGAPIDVGPNKPLSETGRAYFGDKIEGSVDVKDFSEYSNATGTMADSLNYPLSKHIQRLNLIRRSIPALRKGQYSTDGVNGSMAFKRRYTNAAEGIDSFALVSITDGASFTGIPNGRYVDAITGDVKYVSNGNLSIGSTGKGDMRIYVLDTSLTKAPGKIGENGTYLK